MNKILTAKKKALQLKKMDALRRTEAKTIEKSIGVVEAGFDKGLPETLTASLILS